MIPTISPFDQSQGMPFCLSSISPKITEVAHNNLNVFQLLVNGLRNMLEPKRMIPISKYTSSLLVFSNLWGRAHGQDTFLTTFGGPGGDGAFALAIDSNGSMIATGYSGYISSTSVGSSDVFLGKWNANGLMTWAKTLVAIEGQMAYALAIDTSNNIITAGTTTSPQTGYVDIFLAKWDTNGSLIWAKTFGETGEDKASAVAIDANDNIVVAGHIGFLSEDGYTFLAKWDASGSLFWAKTFGRAGEDEANAIVLDANDSIIVAGDTTGLKVNYRGVLLTKWDADGSLTWAKTLNVEEGGCKANALVLDASSNIIAAGPISENGATTFFFLAKWDADGSLTWAKTLVGRDYAYDLAAALTIDASGSIIVAGYTYTLRGDFDALITKWDADGSLTWAETLGGKNEDVAAALAIDASGNIIVAGSTRSFGEGFEDILLSRLNSDGVIHKCSYVQAIKPRVKNFATPFTATLNVTSQNWTNITVLPWSGLTVSTISNAEEASQCPRSTTKTPSSSSTDQIPLIAGLAAGGAVLVLGLGLTSLGLILHRRKKTQKSADALLELENTKNSTSLSPNPHEENSLVSPTSQGNNFSPIRKEGRTKIDNTYALVRKINRKEAAELSIQTGIVITFPEGENKAKPLIGAGRFGKLRIAQRLSDERFVGVKKIKGAQEIAESRQEAALQNKLTGLPHIMPLLDSVETVGSNEEPVLYQFMPLAGFGSGDSLQAALSHISDAAIKKQILGHVAKSVLTGLVGMHSRHIAHLDLKGSNIVMNQDGEVSIIDFGCAMESEHLEKLVGGNGDSRYFSPERLAYCRYALNIPSLHTAQSYSGVSADLWALGLMLLELMNNEFPFGQTDLKQRLASWNTETFLAQLAPALATKEYAPLAQLIQKLLAADQDLSISATILLNDPLFADPAYMFPDEMSRRTRFGELKYDVDKAPTQQNEYFKKSEDKRYIQCHYAKSPQTHTYVNSS